SGEEPMYFTTSFETPPSHTPVGGGGQATSMAALAVIGARPSALAVAVLEYDPQAAAVVSLRTVTVREAPAASVPKSQLSTSGEVPAMLHPATGAVMLQSIPAPPGSGSLRETPVASAGPVLVTVMVKLIGSPAATAEAPAVLLIVSPGCGGGGRRRRPTVMSPKVWSNGLPSRSIGKVPTVAPVVRSKATIASSRRDDPSRFPSPAPRTARPVTKRFDGCRASATAS